MLRISSKPPTSATKPAAPNPTNNVVFWPCFLVSPIMRSTVALPTVGLAGSPVAAGGGAVLGDDVGLMMLLFARGRDDNWLRHIAHRRLARSGGNVGTRIQIELEFRAARPKLHVIARREVGAPTDALLVEKGAVARTQVFDEISVGIARVAPDFGVLARHQIVHIARRIVFDLHAVLAPENNVEVLISRKIFGRIGLRATQVAKSDFFAFFLS